MADCSLISWLTCWCLFGFLRYLLPFGPKRIAPFYSEDHIEDVLQRDCDRPRRSLWRRPSREDVDSTPKSLDGCDTETKGDERVTTCQDNEGKIVAQNSRRLWNSDIGDISVETDDNSNSAEKPEDVEELHNGNSESQSPMRQKEVDEEERRRLQLERMHYYRELLSDEDVEFILNSNQTVIPQQLLDSFLNVHREGSSADICIDAALNFAQNLPAVMFIMGRENWPLFKGTFLYLCLDSRVEPALAATLHELAAILGPDISDADLVPVFNGMAKSNEEVKSLLVMHLFDFLGHLSAPARTAILMEINCFLTSQQERNWRFRYEFIVQCAKLCDIFSLDLLNKYLWGVALELCTDQVASVRDVALDLVIEILARFVQSEWKATNGEERKKDDMPLSNALCEDLLRGFGNSQNWRRRQTFATCCEKILKTNAMSDEQFAFFFGDVFLKLAGDRVANVRLKFCEALDRGRGPVDPSDKDKENIWFTDERRSGEILDRLRDVRAKDEEVSVRIAACRALGVSEDDELNVKGPNLRELEMIKFEHLRKSMEPFETSVTPGTGEEGQVYCDANNSTVIESTWPEPRES